MFNKFWLIQRGTFRNLDTATDFLGGRPECLIDPDYMGSAEFEWGAIPRAYRRIMGQFNEYSLYVTDLVTVRDVPFCLYCRDDRYEVILEAIKQYLKEGYKLKEYSNMGVHFDARPIISPWEEKHRKYQFETNFWWCIDTADIGNDKDCHIVGDWIAFVGATDRQKAFNRVISSDYANWWMAKSEDVRSQEFVKSFQNY